MKLVAISRVRNEADIIEAFVRHHAVYFGKLIVLDDGSCDGTYEALQSLKAEGLPLVVLQESAVGYEQSQYMTRLLQVAVAQFGADWIAPLDADEFIELEAGVTLADTLSREGNRLLSLAWNNFEWRPEDDDSSEPNPVVRQRFRLPPRSDLNKLLVPACLVDEMTQLSQGNHALIRNGNRFAPLPLQSVNLGHFPIRSLHQYASKIAVHYLQYVAMPNWDRRLGFQNIEPFQALLTGGLDALKERMPMDSRHYSIAKEARQEQAATSRENPLRYQGGPLKLALLNSAFLQNILCCAEAIARDRAIRARRTRAASADLGTESGGGAITSPEQPFAVSDDAIDEPHQSTSEQLGTLRHRLRVVHEELERLNGDKDRVEMRLSRTELELFEARQQLSFQAELLNSRTSKLAKRVNKLIRSGLSPHAALNRLSLLRRR